MKHIEMLLDDILKYATIKNEALDLLELKPRLMELLTIDDVEGMSHVLEMAEDVVLQLWISHNLSEKIRNRVDFKIQQVTWLVEDATLILEGRYPNRVAKIHQRLEQTMLERIMWNPEEADEEEYDDEEDI